MTLKIICQVRLKSRPKLRHPQADNFEIVDAAVPELADRQFLVRTDSLSVEPAMRGWVAAAANYSTPGRHRRGDGCRLPPEPSSRRAIPIMPKASRSLARRAGRIMLVSDGKSITRKVKEADLPLSLSLGMLGLNGVTAYFGLLDLGQPRPGDTVAYPRRRARSAPRSDKSPSLQAPHRRTDRRRCQGQTLPRGIRLRRSHRLQGRKTRRRAEGNLSARRRRLFRQYPGHYQRRGDAATCDRRTHRDLRHRLGIELGPPPSGPRVERQILVKRARALLVSLPSSSASLRRGHRPARDLGPRWPHSLSRGHRRRHRERPGRDRRTLSRREFGQADDPARVLGVIPSCSAKAEHPRPTADTTFAQSDTDTFLDVTYPLWSVIGRPLRAAPVAVDDYRAVMMTR